MYNAVIYIIQCAAYYLAYNSKLYVCVCTRVRPEPGHCVCVCATLQNEGTNGYNHTKLEVVVVECQVY